MWSDVESIAIPTVRIGPGVLVLVVGPSGAGKDTLIAIARSRLAHDPGFVFARRTVTRPSSLWEQHDTLSPEAFCEAAAKGAFCLAWEAHGLHYGLPSLLIDEIEAGRTVVANVSRKVVIEARSRFEHVVCITVTAPLHLLAQRLASRTRDDVVTDRLARANAVSPDERPDATIENIDAPEVGAARLVQLLQEAARAEPYGSRASAPKSTGSIPRPACEAD